MADLETITIGELPTITEIGENDTVLIASGGRMKKANPSLVGGGSTLVVTTSYSGDPEGTYTITFDKTYAEIAEAMLNGSVVIDDSALFAFFGATVPTGTKKIWTILGLTYDNEYGISTNDYWFSASTKNDYPSAVISEVLPSP